MTEWKVYELKRTPRKRHKKIYTAPKGKFIVDIVPSRLPNGDDRMLVVLNDNTVKVLNPFTGNLIRSFSIPTSQSYEGVKHLIGDDMWMLSSYGLLYMSSDSGLNWSLDTAGVGQFAQ